MWVCISNVFSQGGGGREKRHFGNRGGVGGSGGVGREKRSLKIGEGGGGGADDEGDGVLDLTF